MLVYIMCRVVVKILFSFRPIYVVLYRHYKWTGDVIEKEHNTESGWKKTYHLDVMVTTSLAH
jgi:hypothetical protein